MIIFPNPAQNIITLSSEYQLIRSVKIIDVLGRIIYVNYPDDKVVTLDVSTINKGMYLVNIHFTDNTRLIKKIVIE